MHHVLCQTKEACAYNTCSCTPGTCAWKDYYSATDTTCTPTNCSCTNSVKSWTGKAGYYFNGTQMTTCTGGYYCAGFTVTTAPSNGTGRSQCNSSYPNSDSGNSSANRCYSNSLTRAWTGSQVNGSVPTNCASVTSWNACSNPSCTYVAYADGTVKSGCSTNSASCTKTVAAVTAKSGYFDNGTTCAACPSGYPNSDDNNEGGRTQCYSNSKSRAWTGSQNACSKPANASAVTCNSCSIAACAYVAYSNAAGTADGTVKSGCSTNNASCNQTVKSATCNAGYAGTTSCPICTGATFAGAGQTLFGMSRWIYCKYNKW